MHTRGNRAVTNAAHTLRSMKNMSKTNYISLVNSTLSPSASVRKNARAELGRRLKAALARSHSSSVAKVVKRLKSSTMGRK